MAKGISCRLAFALTLLYLAGGASGRTLQQTDPTPTPTPTPTTDGMEGNDADAHGCRASAGYRWCGPLEKCVGPMEPCLLLGPGPVIFPPSGSTNNNGDGGSSDVIRPGGDSDAHGCRASAGYRWCESIGKCIAYSEACPEFGGDGHRIYASTGSSACPGPMGLLGGWSEASTTDESTLAAVNFVIATVKPSNTEYVIKTACIQVVAGLKHFLRVELVGGGGFMANLLQPLPSDTTYNTPYQILDLVFEN